MPYIDSERRQEIAQGADPENPGELTYAITRLVDRYIVQSGMRFQVFSEVFGALEAVKLELYRRVVGRYEDAKLLTNGDAFASAHMPYTTDAPPGASD